MGLREEDGKQLLKAHRGDPEALKGNWKTRLGKLATQVQKGGMFPSSATAAARQCWRYDELVAKAAELRKSDPKLTSEQAYTRNAPTDPANLEIAKREREERARCLQWSLIPGVSTLQE